MRYPFVLFCRDASYADVDDVIQKYKDENKFFCSLFIIDPNDKESLRLLYDANYHFLITYGNTFDEYKDRILDVIDESMLCRHKHMDVNCLLNIEQFNQTMNTFYIQICLLPREKIRPVFSLFTTSFNSYDKIFRVYNSLLVQTLKSWEWVIVDDSPDIKHFEWLLTKFDKDPRIRIYRRSKNNGSIGNVKNESIGLCRGNYVLEMDHDDEILPYTLKMAADEFDKDPELGFVYMDFVCVYETDGNNQFYGDFICKGYGGYYSEKINGRWRLVYSTPNINNITMSHLVCCPNHPRMWRRDTLLALGSYCEYLPICDDYEIILRSSVGTKCAKIHKTGYFQYMNSGSNNFSLIRNAEINRIGPNYISPQYFDGLDINNKMKEMDAYESDHYIRFHSKIWTRDPNTWSPKYCNRVINPDYDTQYCIIGYDALLKNIEEIKELYKNPRNDFLLLDNNCKPNYLWYKLERLGFERMKCYALMDTPSDQLERYFKLIYCSVSDYKIISENTKQPIKFTTIGSKHDLINIFCKSNLKLIEFKSEKDNHIDNILNNIHIKHKTSIDIEIYDISGNNEYDVIYMSSYTSDKFYKDFIRIHEFLKADDAGLVIIGNLIPLNYEEQMKEPDYDFIVDGIVKRDREWTGDKWKIVYYILKKYNNDVILNVFKTNNTNEYVGVIQVKAGFKPEINMTEVDKITYFDNFNEYCSIINSFY